MRLKIEVLAFLLWLGIHLTCGYVVAPVLFNALPREEAGNLAGTLFHVAAYAGLICGAILWMLAGARQRFQAAYRPLLALAWIAILVNEFLITPVIVAHKTETSHFLLKLLGGSFSVWHGISSSIYLFTAVCGLLALMLWVSRLNRR